MKAGTHRQQAPSPRRAAGRVASALAAAALAAVAALAEPVEIEAHRLAVRLDPETGTLAVQDRIELRIPLAATMAELRLAARLRVTALRAQDVRRLAWDVEREAGAGRQVVRFAVPPGLRDRTVWLEIDYGGTLAPPPPRPVVGPIVPSRTTLGALGDDVVLLDRDSGWIPQAAERRAALVLELDVPEPWRVVTSVAADAPGGDSAHGGPWRAAAVAAAPVVAVGRWVVRERLHDAISVRAAARTAARAESFLDAAQRALDTATRRLGPYPRAAVVVVETPPGTLVDDVGLALVGAGVAAGSDLLEDAVQRSVQRAWWGGRVHPDPRGGDWSEALVAYLGEHLHRERDPARAREWRARAALAYAASVPAARDYPLRLFAGVRDAHDLAIGRDKGAMLFHLLRRRCGDAAFFAALRDVARRGARRAVGWQAFVAAFATAAGDEHVDTIAAAWLDRPGLPDPALLRPSAERTPDGRGWEMSVQLAFAESHPYRLRLPLRIHFAAGGSETIEIAAGAESTLFARVGPRRPVALEIDPELHVLRRWRGSPPPTLGATLATPGLRVAWAAVDGAALADRYRELAVQAAHELGTHAVRAEAVEMLAGGAWLLFGVPRRGALTALPVAEALAPSAADPGSPTGPRRPDEVRLGSAVEPTRPPLRVTVLAAASAAGLDALPPLRRWAWVAAARLVDGRAVVDAAAPPVAVVPVPRAAGGGSRTLEGAPRPDLGGVRRSVHF